MTKQETLRKLFEENGLEKEDVFVMKRKDKNGGYKNIPIITRMGIEKIQAKHGIEVNYEMQHISEDGKFIIVKAKGRVVANGKIEAEAETYGEASPANNTNAYVCAMAEKRALSRVVLKIAGFYQHGVFGEDEPAPESLDNGLD